MKLGTMINILKTMPQDKQVLYDFCRMRPTTLDSYRGYYDQLALGHTLDSKAIFVRDLIKELESADGATFHGWKGGDFTMCLETEVWVDDPGEATSTVIDDVLYDGYWAVIITTKNEEVAP